jgi:hypothetical protein
MGTGLYLDAIGEVKSNRMLDVYKSEDDARRVWDACAKWIANKDKIAAFWNNATEADRAFKEAGAIIGQTWDTTGLLLNREDAKWKYRAPKEGGITWMDSMGMPKAPRTLSRPTPSSTRMLTPNSAACSPKTPATTRPSPAPPTLRGDDLQAPVQRGLQRRRASPTCGGGRPTRRGSRRCVRNTSTRSPTPDRHWHDDRGRSLPPVSNFIVLRGRAMRGKDVTRRRVDDLSERFHRRSTDRPDHRGGRVLLDPRAVRLRQDDDPACGSPASSIPRPGRVLIGGEHGRHRAEPPPDRFDFPEPSAVPANDRVGKRRLRAGGAWYIEDALGASAPKNC